MNLENHGRQSLIKIYSDLINCETDDVKKIWRRFKDCVLTDYRSAAPVAEYVLLPNIIERFGPAQDCYNLKILNHGSGSGLPDLYWVALGYTQLVSVDIYSEHQQKLTLKLNHILKLCCEIEDDIFFLYDGKKLPVEDGSVDVVNSNAVVEHLTDVFFENYFKEESRVLRGGGVALHVIPQRLQPFDSHTQTWCIHWLPRSWHSWLIKQLGKHNIDVPVVLRSKYTHLRILRKYIGKCRDISVDYFMNSEIKREDFYDKKSQRGLAYKLCNLPILKIFLPSMVSPMLCLITVTTRNI